MKAEGGKKQGDDQKGAIVRSETLDVGTAGHLSGQESPLR